MGFTISLVARNQGVEYVDDTGRYHFDVYLSKGVWTVCLPPTFGASFETVQLTDDQRRTILPRVIEYLQVVRWFGFFKKTYRVELMDRSESSR